MDFELTTRIHQTLVAGRARQFQFLRELVAERSENPPGDAEAMSARVARELKALGLGVERHQVPNDVVAGLGLKRVTNLVSRHVFGAGNVVALNAHGDTRPVGGGWTADPFTPTVKAGVVTGLGVQAKADIAAYAYALAALVQAKPELAGTVELHLGFDGENGGEAGPKWLLENRIVNPDYAIASGLAYGIGTSAMGDLQLEVEIARAPGKGTRGDAMETAGRVMAALYALRDELKGVASAVPGIASPTLVIGEIEGGRRPDRPPEKVTFRLVRRLIPDEDVAAAERALTRRIAEAASADASMLCRIRRLKLLPPMKPVAGAGRLAATLERQASRVAGKPVGSYGVAFDTEARHYAARGIPTVLYGAGPERPEDAGAGGADERLVLDDLRLATEVIAFTLAEFLAPAG